MSEVYVPVTKTIRERFCEAYKLFETAQKNSELTYGEKEKIWKFYQDVRDEWLSHVQSTTLLGRFDS